MQIFASIRGTFLEPADAGYTTEDLVSFLQFEAHSLQEAQVLRSLYRVIQRGGVIRVRRGESGFLLHTDAPPPEARNEARSSDEGTSVRKVASKPSARRKKLAEFPLLSPDGEKTDVVTAPPNPPAHVHAFSAKVQAVNDPEGTWLKCACGTWEYFARRTEGSLLKVTKKRNMN